MITYPADHRSGGMTWIYEGKPYQSMRNDPQPRLPLPRNCVNHVSVPLIQQPSGIQLIYFTYHLPVATNTLVME